MLLLLSLIFNNTEVAYMFIQQFFVLIKYIFIRQCTLYTFEENVQLKLKQNNLIKLYIKPLKKGCEEYENPYLDLNVN